MDTQTEKVTIVKSELGVAQVKTETEWHGDWKFEVAKTRILTSTELDQLVDKIKVQRIPDVVYGRNFFELVHTKSGFTYLISANDSLAYTSFARVKETLLPSYGAEKKTNRLDAIQIEPSEVKVKEAMYWQDKKMPEDAEIKVLEKISDWTYSTPYKGTILVQKKDEDLDNLTVEIDVLSLENKKASGVYLEETDQEIPVSKLGPSNPIIWFNEILLFEDELDDSGLSQSTFRFRTMKDCYFGLLRFYLRVDEVLIRIYDTRIYHEYGTNYILRENTVRESSYAELRSRGFKFNSEFNMNHSQSDIVYQVLNVRSTFRDKVVFG